VSALSSHVTSWRGAGDGARTHDWRQRSCMKAVGRVMGQYGLESTTFGQRALCAPTGVRLDEGTERW